MGWSKKGIGKSRRSSSRASIPSRFWRCWRIHCAGFSENRPWRVLPTITEIVVISFSFAACLVPLLLNEGSKPTLLGSDLVVCEFTLGLEPILQITAGFFTAFEIDFVC